MTLLKMTIPVVTTLSLAACMDSTGADVARTATPAANCAYHSGLSAAHLEMIGNTRCGPQTELPYTLAN